MVNKFVFSSKQILSVIEKQLMFTEDFGITKMDFLAIIVEYLEYSRQSIGNPSIEKYLNNNWLMNKELIPKVALFTDKVLTELHIFCPEITDVLANTDNLRIAHYNRHMFILERN